MFARKKSCKSDYMTNFKSINWFRLCVVVGLSVVSSLAMFYGDEQLSRGEIVNTLLQATIVSFSFLQCPEDGIVRKFHAREKSK